MRVELVYVQFNISDTYDLFWCSVLIILEMVRLDILFLYFAGQQTWLCFYLLLNFLAKPKFLIW